MPVPAGSMPGGHGAPSTFDKLKMGGMMGGSVGLIIGFIFGFTNIVRYGPGPNGMMRTLGQYMLGSAATFGFFMAIGTTIRTDASPIASAVFAEARGRPMVLPPRYRYARTTSEESK
ncbi:hypothetical protein M011DRAFT_491642 [Sporormia fimetaria CBS 119925]|uniref:Mitochondrial genome maintenance protein Mgr2 n=1 Tax=Sporormia fimetaria CBS 119925 TaxID=1340428 RepID=A0A6A6VNR9_9PLEO|nr:hypothetical protein M011DRAFT_491642 [Sporormia fimetaria CBS 119925]